MQGFYIRETLSRSFSVLEVKDRLSRYGGENLSDLELLMIVLDLKENTIKNILNKYTLYELAHLSLDDFQQVLGTGKANRLFAGFELAKRALGKGITPIISCPADTLAYLGEIKDKTKEHFCCLYLNARNQLIHTEIVSIGSLSASIVHPREVFHQAILHSSASIILAHNHPSSDVSPSKEDIELTQRLVKAGEIMGIDVLDHIIIGSSDFVSLKEKGLV